MLDSVRSWESAVRGFRPSFFPWLAVIPPACDPNKDDLSFFSHRARSNGDCIYKRPIAMLCGGGGNISFVQLCVSSSSKDCWMVFVGRDDGVPIIVNPLTDAQPIQPLPSIHTLCKRRLTIGSIVFLPDNNVAIAECGLEEDYHVLAAATPGDDEWSATHVSESWFNCSIVFHETDSKFYILNRCGKMRSFRLIRCGRKTVFCEVSSILARATEYLSFESRLMFDGTSLLQVRKCYTSKEFEILKYNADADLWVKMTNMDFGNNALFFDRYGARMLPLPHQREEMRRNCIYFINHEFENYQHIHYVRMYDMGKGTVDPYFSRIYRQSNNRNFFPAIMCFTPSLLIKN